ncbi:unnamed protein product [Calypogeia fissa]
MKPLIKNFFENTAIVQFDHRILAITTLSSIGGMWITTLMLPLHPAVKSLLDSTLSMAGCRLHWGYQHCYFMCHLIRLCSSGRSLDSFHNSSHSSAYIKEAITCSLRALTSKTNVVASKSV